jgi:hypothetical protein
VTIQHVADFPRQRVGGDGLLQERHVSLEHAVPNFYFHLTHVYALLRHNGVPLGKRDFLGALTQRTP